MVLEPPSCNTSFHVGKHQYTLRAYCYNTSFSQTVFMISITTNRAEHACTTVIIKLKYVFMCEHKPAISIMLSLLNYAGHM